METAKKYLAYLGGFLASLLFILVGIKLKRLQKLEQDAKVQNMEEQVKSLRENVAKHREDVNAKESELRSKEAEYRHLRRLANQNRNTSPEGNNENNS